jgi:23S rRNA (cytosine1962-C5)-methyltransferase
MLDDYALIDFGEGRKLERFGRYVLDRPSPAAEGVKIANRSGWRVADARYERTSYEGTGGERGRWMGEELLSGDWTMYAGPFRLRLKPTPFGHVGVFPEQAPLWDWIAANVASAGRTIRVLNLFAYTGGSTLAAAAAGAEVVHVDAAANTVAWARENAAVSSLEGTPIRWIVDDAAKFVAREVKRERRYDGVILDPPSYGHGPKGQAWKIETDLPPLLDACGQLLTDDALFLLLTHHTPDSQVNCVEAVRAATRMTVERGELSLVTADGRTLCSGACIRAARKTKT